MKFNKVRKTVAILLLFALFFSAFPMSVVANNKDETEETVTTEETLNAETNIGPTDGYLESAQSGENNTAETSQEVQTQEAGIEPEMGQGVTGPDKDGLYTDTEGNQFYLVSNGTRAVIRIYKRYWGYVDFSGPGGVSGNFPYLATSTSFTNQTDFGTTGEWVYCIQFNQSSADVDDSDSEDLSQSAYWNSLADYQKNGILLAASYGAQNGNGHNTIYDYMATQLIIWEYQLGWRTSATTTTNSYYNMITSGWSYIKDEYNRILSDIGKAEKKPAFNTYSHTFEQTGTNFDFEDANGALSQGAWEIANTPSELSASIVGNKLRVSANSYFTGTKTVTLKRDIPGSAKNAFVYKTGSQHAITGTDNTTVTVSVSLKQPKKVKIEKGLPTNTPQSVKDCIGNNPLYTLAGAKYAIYTEEEYQKEVNKPGSGKASETLTTVVNENVDHWVGTATSSKEYKIGDTLYAVEIKAPSGYLKNTTAAKLVVTADETNNVFKVSDVPTFDPQILELKKTGTSGQFIPGAIFKAEFFASTTPSGTAQRTWYFKSDESGSVLLKDSHFAAGYQSDELFKPTGTNVQIPLGCIRVTEVKAAPGYILPAGNQAVALIKITQPTSGEDAVANWDVSGNNIYSLTNNAVTAVNTEQGTATMKKSLPSGMNGNLEGYCFNLYRVESETTWRGRSDANGNIYKTNASYSEYAEASRVYTFTGLEDGTYAFRELLNGKNAKTTKVRLYTSGGLTANFDHTYTGSELTFVENGDCVIGNIALTGLNGGGTLTIEIENTPLPGTMTMRKALTAGTWGSKEGYFFNVHRVADTAGSANTWYGRSDNNGNIYSTNQNHTEVSVNERVYTFAGMTDGTYVIRELMNGKDARTEKIRIYTSGGETAAFDHTYTGSDLSFENNGDCVLSNIPITGLNGGGTLTIEITNTPIYGEPFELIKVDASDTSVTLEGAIFKVELYDEDMLSDDDDDPEYTWYFATDEHGYFVPTEHYLADPSTGYVSDQMLQNDGDFPLGYMVVTEVKAPEGFKKSDVIGYWRMVRSTTNPYKSDCYWANPDGTHATLGYGELAFILPQDDPDALYVKDAPYVKLNIFKTSPNSTVNNIEFLVEKQVGTTWQNIKVGGGYFKTNASGQIIVDDSQVIGELEVGMILRITENVPQGTICTSENPQTITLVAGDNNTVTFENVEISLKIYKTASDNKVKDIDFEVSKYVNNQWVLLGTYTTNASGQIDIETEHLAVGAKFRIKELVPVGTYCTGTNPKTITLTMGPNYVTFNNTPIKLEIVKTSTDGAISGIDFVVDCKNDANEWDNIGTFATGTDGKIDVPKQYLIQGATYRITEIVPENYICTTQNPQIITLNQATTTVNFSNKPFSGLEIIKTSPDGNVANIEFVIEKQVLLGQGGFITNWEILDPKNPTYLTNEKGKIVIDNDAVLETGMVLRITEHVPDGYICTSENPKTITLSLGKNSVTFENIPVAKLSLYKRSDDGHVDGIRFKLEKKRPSEHSSTGLVVKERWDLLGTYTTHDGGIILPEEFGALDYDGIYRVTEIVPQGYICENPVQTFTAGIDSEGNPVTEHQVTFENRRIYGNLEITKVDESYPDHKLTGAEFTVIMSKFGSEDLETAIMSEVLDEQGNGTGVYRLEHIEYGTTCEIRETAAPDGYELSDEMWRVTIEEEKTYTITTPNFDAVINRQIEGQLSVHKEDAEHNAMSGVQFLLEYSVDEGKNWAPVQARTAEDPVLPGYCTSDGLTDGILTTGADGNIVFTGLALSTEINSNVTYRLTEVKTQNGNTLMGISVFEGPLTIDEPELSYKVVNESVFTMPRTGSNGFVGTGIAIGLAILAALIILLNLPRGKKNKKEII